MYAEITWSSHEYHAKGDHAFDVYMRTMVMMMMMKMTMRMMMMMSIINSTFTACKACLMLVLALQYLFKKGETKKTKETMMHKCEEI